MRRDLYRRELRKLEKAAKKMPLTRFAVFGLTQALATLILRWEKIMVDRRLRAHPFPLAADLVKATGNSLRQYADVARLAVGKQSNSSIHRAVRSMEPYHQKLFQALWIKYNPRDHRKRVAQYVYRLKINGLEPIVKGKKCIDFGCGHGNFAHALISLGASQVLGID